MTSAKTEQSRLRVLQTDEANAEPIQVGPWLHVKASAIAPQHMGTCVNENPPHLEDENGFGFGFVDVPWGVAAPIPEGQHVYDTPVSKSQAATMVDELAQALQALRPDRTALIRFGRASDNSVNESESALMVALRPEGTAENPPHQEDDPPLPKSQALQALRPARTASVRPDRISLIRSGRASDNTSECSPWWLPDSSGSSLSRRDSTPELISSCSDDD